MKEKICGTLTVNKEIDITDPCYDEDVWCRINRFPVDPGEYECYVEEMDDEETNGWGKRISKIGIRRPGVKGGYCERKGMIGVDTGLAGFFTCDNLKVFEDVISNSSFQNVYIGDGYFCSSSGYGDGAYDVFARYDEGKIVDIFIRFI